MKNINELFLCIKYDLQARARNFQMMNEDKMCSRLKLVHGEYMGYFKSSQGCSSHNLLNKTIFL